MSDIEITIKLPEQLVERARAVKMNVEEELVKAIEQDIRSREAAQKLLDIAEQIDTLPDDIKPTPDEIVAIVRQIREKHSS